MKYYDPEYGRIVDESVPKKQYEWFSAQSWFHKTYEEFLRDNFLNEDMSEIAGERRVIHESKTAYEGYGQ